MIDEMLLRLNLRQHYMYGWIKQCNKAECIEEMISVLVKQLKLFAIYSMSSMLIKMFC